MACGTSVGVLFKVENGHWDLNYEMSLKKLRILNKKNPYLSKTNNAIDEHFKPSELLAQTLRSRIGLFDTEEFEEIYIFCPKEMSGKLCSAIENDVPEIKIQIARYGNFARKDPELLFKRVNEMIRTSVV